VLSILTPDLLYNVTPSQGGTPSRPQEWLWPAVPQSTPLYRPLGLAHALDCVWLPPQLHLIMTLGPLGNMTRLPPPEEAPLQDHGWQPWPAVSWLTTLVQASWPCTWPQLCMLQSLSHTQLWPQAPLVMPTQCTPPKEVLSLERPAPLCSTALAQASWPLHMGLNHVQLQNLSCIWLLPQPLSYATPS
jgi:hypothetical protein